MRAACARRTAARGIKRILPRSLLGRSLLMILVPLVLLQAVALQIFYGSHLDVVSRRLSGGDRRRDRLHAGAACSRYPDAADRAWILRTAREQFDAATCSIEPGAALPDTRRRSTSSGPMDDDLARRAAREGPAAVHHGLDVRRRARC